MIVFVIPAYNEERNLPQVIERTKRKMEELGYDYSMIIIDDGSTDSTKEIVSSLSKTLPIDLISYSPNRGVGEAFRKGFKRAVEVTKDGDVIISKEADSTSDLTVLQDMIQQVYGGFDLALASCYARGGGVIGTTVDRIILSKAANILTKMFLRIKTINTFSSFYRCYSSGLLRRAQALYGDKLIEEDGFVCMVELLVKLNAMGAKIVEVPMILDARGRLGKSKMKRWKTIRGYFGVFAKYGFLRDYGSLRPQSPDREIDRS
jgi:dolichol-phosphate mannosyltransferase